MSWPRITDPEAVEDLIEQWHNGAGGGIPLHEFLGWTSAEYSAYVFGNEVPS